MHIYPNFSTRSRRPLYEKPYQFFTLPPWHVVAHNENAWYSALGVLGANDPKGGWIAEWKREELLLEIYSGGYKKSTRAAKKLLSHIMTAGTYKGLEQENALPLASQLTFVRRIHTCLVSFPSYTHQGTMYFQRGIDLIITFFGDNFIILLSRK